MPKHYILFVFLLFFSGINLTASPKCAVERDIVDEFDENSVLYIDSNHSFYEMIDTVEVSAEREKMLRKARAKEKLICIGLCIALGPFGVHRLFLGTTEKVPILYTLTLGGGLGVLPIVDLFTIIFTKDLTKYRNNSNVFLWTPSKEIKENKG